MSDQKAAILIRAENLGWPAVVLSGTVVADNPTAWRSRIGYALPGELPQVERQLAELETEADRKAEIAAHEAERATAADAPDVFEDINRETLREVAERAAFQATDSGRLERIAELLERIEAKLK